MPARTDNPTHMRIKTIEDAITFQCQTAVDAMTTAEPTLRTYMAESYIARLDSLRDLATQLNLRKAATTINQTQGRITLMAQDPAHE